MKEVIKNLFIGNEHDYYNTADSEDNFSYVLAAKNPFHKDFVGYEGKSCDKSHPEYLWAYSKNKLILNMVDAPSSLFFDKSMVDETLKFIEEELFKGRYVLIACNKGESRSASLGLLFLIKQGHIKGETLEDCEAEFLKLYPQYNPGKGIREFVKEHFQEYRQFLSNNAFIKMKPVAEKCGVTDEELKALIKKLDNI